MFGIASPGAFAVPAGHDATGPSRYQRFAETGCEAVTWFAKNVRAPDNISVLRFEGWQDSVEAVADRRIKTSINRVTLVLRPVENDFAAMPSLHFSQMVNDCRR